MSSIKAQQEILELKHEIAEIELDIKRKNDRAYKPNVESWLRDSIRKEVNALYNKQSKKEDKIREISEFGYSTREIGSLKRELAGFKSLSYHTSIGSRDIVKVGFSKALNNYVIVSYMKFTSFMRNVRGAGSLAGKSDINSIKIISQRQYEAILNQEHKSAKRPTGWERSRASVNTSGLQMFR